MVCGMCITIHTAACAYIHCILALIKNKCKRVRHCAHLALAANMVSAAEEPPYSIIMQLVNGGLIVSNIVLVIIRLITFIIMV